MELEERLSEKRDRSEATVRANWAQIQLRRARRDVDQAAKNLQAVHDLTLRWDKSVDFGDLQAASEILDRLTELVRKQNLGKG
jgi:uncharacterized membrane protein YccC